jgi:hypothetical protein
MFAGSSMKLFEVGGTAVRVHPTFFLREAVTGACFTSSGTSSWPGGWTKSPEANIKKERRALQELALRYDGHQPSGSEH